MKKTLLIVATTFSLTINAQIITTIAGNGTQGYSGDGLQATAAELSYPVNIALDAIGNLYISDQTNYRVRKVNTAGIISTCAGTGTGTYSGDGGQATAAGVGPNGIALDAIGNLYIGDGYRIRKVNTSGIISTIAGNGTFGYSGDGGQATAAQFKGVSGIAFDAAGNLYFSDGGNNNVRKITTSGIISTVAGNGTSGYSGDGGQATAAEFYSPNAITFDAAGNLYIADGYNERIRKVISSGIINTYCGDGTLGYIGNGYTQAAAAEINYPYGMQFDTHGNFYFADQYNNLIRKVATTGLIYTIAGHSTGGGYSGDGGQATLANLNFPSAVAFDALGNLYIADASNNCIRKVTNVANAGIEQFANNSSDINIYPNPNNGSFTIEPQNILYNVHYTMYDVNGKAVLSQIINGKTTIDASNLNEGVYNLSLQSNQGIVNKRIVIVR